MDLYHIEPRLSGREHSVVYIDTHERLMETIRRSWPNASISGAGYMIEVWKESRTGRQQRIAAFIATPIGHWPKLPNVFYSN